VKALAPLLTLLAACAAGPLPSDLIVCGGDEVVVVDLRDPASPKTTWRWRASDRPELPEPFRKKFATTDDGKPLDGGRRILITSSGGAVALVDRASGGVLFYAAAPNAHSAEALPNNRLVVACSTHTAGNRLVLYDLSTSDAPLASDELTGAHGAVLDEARGLLWALGTFELRAYDLKDLTSTPPAFTRRQTHTLPNEGGHDLRPIPDRPGLMATTHHHVWVFDRDLRSFRTFPRLGDLENVKSVDFDPASGALAYVKAETSWWAERVKFLEIERTLEFPGRKVYKARWCPPLD